MAQRYLGIKYIKFCFYNPVNDREGNNGRTNTTLFFDNEKKISIDFAKVEICFIFQAKSCLSEFAFIFTTISQIIGTEYYELLHKHLET